MHLRRQADEVQGPGFALATAGCTCEENQGTERIKGQRESRDSEAVPRAGRGVWLGPGVGLGPGMGLGPGVGLRPGVGLGPGVRLGPGLGSGPWVGLGMVGVEALRGEGRGKGASGAFPREEGSRGEGVAGGQLNG
eukprot:204585-Chlamydomonas_euryale.AAC.2